MKKRTPLRLFALCLILCLCLPLVVACDKQTRGETETETRLETTTELSTTEESTTETETAEVSETESDKNGESESERESEGESESESETAAPALDTNSMSDLKLGVILLHDERSLYDLNFVDAIENAKTELGLTDEQVIYKKNVREGNECYDVVVELVESGCNIIFANSYGHEAFLLKAAKEFPDVEFCHASGIMAGTEQLDNFHNAFAAIHTGKFLAGVAAGLKLDEMIEEGTITEEEAKMGYIASWPYAENVSALTAFYLGAKYVCPSVTMDVVCVYSWYEPTGEETAALVLINSDCVLISQESHSLGAPTVCAQANVPFIASYENAVSACPDSVIMSASIDWTPYFLYICNQFSRDEAIATNWTGTLATGSVVLSEVNDAVAAAGTQETLDEIKAKLMTGEIQVFDTDRFTVNNEHLASYMADVDFDEAYMPDTQVIFDGYFHESEFRSAPYFDIRIDGITFLG